MRTIFLSAATDDFEHLRTEEIEKDFKKTGYSLNHQDLFAPGWPENILEQLDTEIKRCVAMVHLIGSTPGSFVKQENVDYFLEKFGTWERYFDGNPTICRLFNEAFEAGELSYTHFEIYVAEKYGKLVFAAVTPEAELDSVQQRHLNRCNKFWKRRYPGGIENSERKTVTDFIKDSFLNYTSEYFESPSTDTREPDTSRFVDPKVDSGKPIGRKSEIDAIGAWLLQEEQPPGDSPLDNMRSATIITGRGGLGKSTIISNCLDNLKLFGSGDQWEGIWAFTFNDLVEGDSIFQALKACASYLDLEVDSETTGDYSKAITTYFANHRVLLVFDSLEPLMEQIATSGRYELSADASEFFRGVIASGNVGRCLISSYWLPESFMSNDRVNHISLEGLTATGCRELAEALKVGGVAEASEDEFIKFRVATGNGNPLLATILCRALVEFELTFKQWSYVVSDRGEPSVEKKEEQHSTDEKSKAEWRRQDDDRHFQGVLGGLIQHLTADNNSKDEACLCLIELASLFPRPDENAIDKLLESDDFA